MFFFDEMRGIKLFYMYGIQSQIDIKAHTFLLIYKQVATNMLMNCYVWYAMLCYAMLCYAALCCAVLCCAVLCRVASCPQNSLLLKFELQNLVR